MEAAVAIAFSILTALTAPSLDTPPDKVIAEARAARVAHRGAVSNRSVFAIVDYDVSWRQERLWVLDAKTQRVVFAAHVRHAAASNDAATGRAVSCSNVPGSLQSSAGAFVTDLRPYAGHYGRSLRVRGLDRGINDNAFARDIVIHPAGRLTFSAGCFMVPDAEADATIDHLAGGVFVYVHGCSGRA